MAYNLYILKLVSELKSYFIISCQRYNSAYISYSYRLRSFTAANEKTGINVSSHIGFGASHQWAIQLLDELHKALVLEFS